MSHIISRSSLRELVGTWLGQAQRVVGPRRVKPERVLYSPLRSADELLLTGFLRPANSIKEFLLPKCEPLYQYRINGNQVELVDSAQPETEQIIVAARPCDAAALPILDHVFNWDFADEFYNRRRRQTTVISLACQTHDDACFCTSVGSGPAAESGSDVILLHLGDGQYEVRSFSDKGRALFATKAQESARTATPAPGPSPKFDPAVVRSFVRQHFEDPLWNEQALTCLGCGACAFTCPTCHCFDIVDAGAPAGNVRVRTWDSCQFPLFTLHASGHNPRATQGNRQRQRIAHKFDIYPEKFGPILCTGCGNCTRNCPAGGGVLPILSEIDHGQRL